MDRFVGKKINWKVIKGEKNLIGNRKIQKNT